MIERRIFGLLGQTIWWNADDESDELKIATSWDMISRPENSSMKSTSKIPADFDLKAYHHPSFINFYMEILENTAEPLRLNLTESEVSRLFKALLTRRGVDQADKASQKAGYTTNSCFRPCGKPGWSYHRTQRCCADRLYFLFSQSGEKQKKISALDVDRVINWNKIFSLRQMNFELISECFDV